MGRFLTRDTFPVNYSNPIELNRYVYVANNPVNMVDPSGHFGVAGYGLSVKNTARALLSGVRGAFMGAFTGYLGSAVNYFFAATGQCGVARQQEALAVGGEAYVASGTWFGAAVGFASGFAFGFVGTLSPLGEMAAFTIAGELGYISITQALEKFIEDPNPCNGTDLLLELTDALIDLGEVPNNTHRGRPRGGNGDVNAAGGAGSNPVDSSYEPGSRQPTENMVNQEWETSCVPACARQMFRDLGVDMDESLFREVFGTDEIDGTYLDMLTDDMFNELAAGTPLEGTSQFRVGSVGVSIEWLQGALSHWKTVIVQLGQPGEVMRHVAIVDSIDGGFVILRDPYGMSGPGSGVGTIGRMRVDVFLDRWERGFGGVILGR